MATKQQISKIAASLVEFQEAFAGLSTEDGQWVIQNTKEAITLFNSAVANRDKAVVKTTNPLLGDVMSSSIIPATTEKFVTKGKFKVDISDEAKVKISYLGSNFKDWFLDKIEEPFAGSKLVGRKLNKASVDGPILQELGGQEKAETTLTELYALMAAQPNGKSGALLNNGFANIFYIKDVSGTLRAVGVRWHGYGWRVVACSVEFPVRWYDGLFVFSRNSSES